MSGMGSRPAVLAILGLAALAAAGPARAAGAPLAEEHQGTVPIRDERQVIVERVGGRISIVPNDAREVSFSSTMGGEKGQPYPIALWEESGILRFAPVEGARQVPRTLEIWVPAGIGVSVQADDSTIEVGPISGQVEIRGKNDKVKAQGPSGSLTTEIEGGGVEVSQAASDVNVRGTGLTVTVDGAAGAVSLRLSGGSAAVGGAQGGIDTDLEGVDFKLGGALGLARIHAKGGRVEATGLEKGAELVLSGTALQLSKARGNVSVESDRDVLLGEVEGAVRVTAYGGVVRAATVKGTVDVTASGASGVQIESVTGAVTVEGDGLQVGIKDVGSTVSVKSGSSEIDLNNATGPVDLQNENGGITAGRVFGDLKVKSGSGDVHLTDLNGPVDVTAGGGDVDVSWASVPSNKDSSIKNETGNVTVRFPGSGGCRVEAVSKYGRVEATGLPRVIVQEGGGAAQGLVGMMNRPLLKIDANGDVSLVGSASAEGGQPGDREP